MSSTGGWATYDVVDIQVDLPEEPQIVRGEARLQAVVEAEDWRLQVEAVLCASEASARSELGHDYRRTMESEGFERYVERPLKFGDGARELSAVRKGRELRILEVRSGADVYRLQAGSSTSEGDRIAEKFLDSLTLVRRRAAPSDPPKRPSPEPRPAPVEDYDRQWLASVLALFDHDPVQAILHARLHFEKINDALLEAVKAEAASESRQRESHSQQLKMAGLPLDGQLLGRQLAHSVLFDLRHSRGDPHLPPPWPEHALAVLTGRADAGTIATLANLPPTVQRDAALLAMVDPMAVQLALGQLAGGLKLPAALALPRPQLIALLTGASPEAQAERAPAQSAAPGLRDVVASGLQKIGLPAAAAMKVAAEVDLSQVVGAPPPKGVLARAEIEERLRQARGELRSGTLDARRCVERVFLDGPIADDEWQAALRGDPGLAKRAGVETRMVLEVAEVAYAWFQEGDLRAAYPAFEAMFALTPDYDYFPSVMAAIEAKEGRTERAIETYGKSIELAQRSRLKSTQAYTNRGELLLMRGDLRRAFDDLAASIRQDPRKVDRFAARARALCRDTPELRRMLQDAGLEDA